MVQKVTKGIKISVQTSYDGTIYRNYRTYHTFSYHITIENKTKDTVQLLERHWDIYDSLNNIEIVEGKGVIGQTPTLQPLDEYTYQSHCVLYGDTGSMKGYFTMLNHNTSQKFKVNIPTFQLTNSVVLN